jgi:hypothetical protein
LELPVSKNDLVTGIFKSPGYKMLTLTIQPCTMEQERALISSLIEDANNNFMANLATEFCMARSLGIVATSEGDSVDTKYIIIGASHAGRLASALRDAGTEVADISEPGWKISADSVASMSDLLREVLEEEWDGEIVIAYQLFDNSSYIGVSTDCTDSLPVKGPHGRYHIIGALGMIDREKFKQLFSMAVPLLGAGGQNKKVLVSPLCRYALENCYEDPSHCTNRGGGLKEAMVAGLANLETWTDDQAYLKRIWNFLVFNPNDFLSPDDAPVTKRDTRL